MKITVIGTGYVGLVTTAVFSKFGHQLIGLDIDKEKINLLNQGQVPFYEPGLEELIKKGLSDKKVIFTSSYQKALKDAEVVFVCVGTPSKASGQIDLSYIKSACQMIAKNASSPLLVVIKSTVPPEIQDIVKPILNSAKHEINLATCPEFLREGSAVEDSLNPDRIIIGAEDKKAKEILLDLHQPIKAPKHVFDINSAQLVKYSANAFLANKISFANQIANLCDRVGADARKVMLGLGLDKRIGRAFLNPGLGFGGSCFPKDTKALSFLAKQHGMDLEMVDDAIKINDQQIKVVLKKIKQLAGSLKDKKIAVLGLAFKPNTDDMRQARSAPLIKQLKKSGAEISAYDPVAVPEAKKQLKDLAVSYADDSYQAVDRADCLVLVTEWPEFKDLDFKKIKKIMRQANIVDGRNLFNPDKLKKLGFKYLGVGLR